MSDFEYINGKNDIFANPNLKPDKAIQLEIAYQLKRIADKLEE